MTTTTVKKWGNSAAARIPSSVLQAAKLNLNETVEIHEESGRIVIEARAKKAYTLDELLAAMDQSNLPELVDWGSPVGKEIW
jgi:antitoxin MazE